MNGRSDTRIWSTFFQVTVDRPASSRPHNLPFPSLSSLFQGREDVTTLLREKLTITPAGRATAIAGKAVHGLGGVGKTRLAVEYAWRYAEEYTAVLFVGSESTSDLRRNLAALCGRTILDLPEQEATEEEIREAAVLRWLNGHSGWLLILDNVDSEDTAVAVDALVARLRGGHVLLTGRLARWSAEIDEIELDVLTATAAAEFLLARTKKRRSTSEDDKLAVVLARELGFLPLALEQAGAYIAERRLTFVGYLEEWKSKHDAVLGWFDPRVSRYPKSVAVTWQTSFDRLSEQARRLLERLAWLGPEPIPESLLDVPVPESSGDESSRDALVELASYSLATRDDETPTFTVHRLVQDVTRGRLRTSDEALRKALGWMNSAFTGDPGDVRNWPMLEPVVPHARAVSEYADAAGITDPTTWLMNQLGYLFFQKALPDEAEPLMRRALELDAKSFGPGHPNVARNLNNLAQLLQVTNRLSEAEPLMRRALDIDEKSFGRGHPNVAIRLNNLAQLLQATNRLSEAEPLMARVVTIFEKSFGKNHPNAATALNNLALLLQATNRLSEAEPLMRRALDIDEKSFGPGHPNVAIDLNNLAHLLQATNRLSEAEPLMRRHVAIFLDFTHRAGHEHPHMQQAFVNYAGLLQDMGKSEEEIKSSLESLFQPPE